MYWGDTGVAGPRVLFVYLTYIQPSLKMAEAMADVLRAKELEAGLAEAQAGIRG